MAMQWSNVIFSGSLSTTATSAVVDARGYKNAFVQVYSPVGGASGTYAVRGTSVQESFVSPTGVAGVMVPLALLNIAGPVSIIPGGWNAAIVNSSAVIPICYDFLRIDMTRSGGTASNVIVVITLQD